MLTSRRAIALSLLLALVPGSPRAEPQAPAPVAAPAPGAYSNLYRGPLFGALFPAASDESAVDESALRYYASLHNVARTNAEIRRLKALHPNWTPPTNIYSAAGSGNDEQPFWDLLADDRLDELHAGIALRMKSEPGWRPSRDLTTKIARKEAILALTEASDKKNWARVLEIADADPSLLHCAYIDADWRVADAFLELGMAARAFEIYHAIIGSCSNHDERLATVRKAISRFPVEQVKSLIAMGAKSDDGASEFDAARIDLTRARIAAVNSGGKSDEIEAADLAEFFADVSRTRERGDLALAGWWEYGHARYPQAEKWFALGAPDAPPGKFPDDVKFVEGRTLSLWKAGDVEAALAVAALWRDASEIMHRAYVGASIALLTRTEPPPAISDANLRDFVAVVQADRSFEGADALAWFHQNRRQWDDSASWFRAALQWRGAEPTAAPPADLEDPAVFKAIEGYATALANLGRVDEALQVAHAWRGADASLRQLFVLLGTSAIGAAERMDAIAPQRLADFIEVVSEDRSMTGAAALGWLQYRSEDFSRSVDWFARAVAWSPNSRGDLSVNQGLALALQRAGRLAEAEEVAFAWRQQSTDMRAAYVAIVVAELSGDKSGKAIGQARLDRFVDLVRQDRSSLGAQALGWRRLNDGNCSYAAPWFRAASAWSSDRNGDAKTAEGLALSLRAVGRFEEAEDVAYGWRDRSSRMRELYLSIGAEALTREIPHIAFPRARLARYSEIVLADHSATGARAIAWRRYGEAGCGFAGNWFRLATLWSDDENRDAKSDEGYALALRAVGRLSEAETIAKRWIATSEAMKKLYIDVKVEALSRDNPPEPLDEAGLADFVGVIEPVKSALGAQALGWYRLERGEIAEAARWFENAVAWWPARHDDSVQRLSAPVEDYKPILARLALHPEDYRRTPRAYPNSSALIGKSSENYVATPEGRAKTYEGYALSLRASGRADEAERIAYGWRGRWPALRRLYLDIAAEQLASADDKTLSSERIARYTAAIEEDRSISGASALAWRDYGRKDFNGAVDWFRRAVDWSAGGADAAPDFHLLEGYALALRSAKKYDEALAVAARYRAASPRFNFLYLETELLALRESGKADPLSAQKSAEIESAMDQAHSRDGALSIGWIAYESRDYPRALSWFQKAVDWSGGGDVDPKALEGLALCLKNLARYDELVDFARQWRESAPAVRRVYYDAMIETLTRGGDAPALKAETSADFEALVETDRSPGGAQAVAWGYAIGKNWDRARIWFKSALDWRGFDPLAAPAEAKIDAAGAKLIEGYVQALRGAGQLAAAEDIAFAWRTRAEALRGLYLQVFTQELAAAQAPLPADRMARFAGVADAERSAVAAQNLGWASYRNRDMATAIGWFEKAIAWSPDHQGDAKTNEGYALALIASGRLAEAEEFAWTRREQSPELRAAYVTAVSSQLFKPELSARVTPARLERFAALVRQDKSAPGAEAMGWRRLQDGNCGYAVGWFRSALAWSQDHKSDDKIRSGLAQALRGVGMFHEAEDVAYEGRDRSPELRALYVNIVIEELTRELPRVEMSQTRVARFAAVALADRSAAAAQALGWRRYGEAGCGYGANWFRLAAKWSSDGVGDAKLNEGYALTLRAVGRLADAEALAYPWIERQGAMKKLYIDIAVEELSRDNPPEPMPQARIAQFEATIAPIRSALGAQALGWYRYSRGESRQGADWFARALDWWPHPRDDGSQKLSAPVEDYQPILARLALRPEDYRRTPRAYPNSSLLIGKDAESYVETTLGLAKTVEGYVLSLSALNRWSEAEALAWQWRDRWPRLRELFIEIAIAEMNAAGATPVSADLVDRLTSLVEADRSAAGAQALAWRGFAAHDYEAASRWFASALDWAKPDEPGNLDVIRAYATSLRESHKPEEALRVLGAWRDRLPALLPLYVEVELDSFRAYDPASPQAAQTLAEIAADVSKAKSAPGAASLGWLAYQRQEFAAAQAWFRQAIVWAPAGAPPDAKALEGYARTLQSQQRYADFLTFTSQWMERVASLKPLYLEAVTQTLAAAAASGEAVPTDMLVRAGEAFAQARSANGAQTLAWQRVSAKDWVAAAAWFQAARAWAAPREDDPKTAEGLVQALRELHRDDEAEELAYARASHDDTFRDLYLEIVADRLTRTPPAPPNEAGLKRYAEFVAAAKAATGAQALGWFSYNARQWPAAIAWFGKSLEWDANESAALGLALAQKQSGDRAAYARVVETYRDRFAKVGDLALGRSDRALEKRAVLEDGAAASPGAGADERPRSDGGSIASALNAKDYSACVARAEAVGALNPAQQNALGWCLMNLGRIQESLRAFDASLRIASGRTRDEAYYGKSLALLAAGEAVAASGAAAEANLTTEQRNAVGVQVLEQRAWAAYNARRYAETLQWLDRRAAFATDTRDLMRLRAWCLRKLGRADAAQAIENSLDDQLSN